MTARERRAIAKEIAYEQYHETWGSIEEYRAEHQANIAERPIRYASERSIAFKQIETLMKYGWEFTPENFKDYIAEGDNARTAYDQLRVLGFTRGQIFAIPEIAENIIGYAHLTRAN